jgi:hypothetical protein
MAISVVCPSCKKRFQVSDQFAGQTGPCPNCKAPIKIPEKGPEVTIHAPETFASGGRGRGGELVTKPIARKQVKLQPVTAAAVVAGVVAAALVAYFARGLFQEMLIARIVGLALISPPLVLAAYWFLRDDELEPYSGKSLYIRAGACALVYMVLWAVFAYVADRGILTGELWTWFFVAPPFLFAGALVAYASLDLDFGNGFFHYAFYLLATVLFGWIAGLGWVWEAAGTA